MAAPQPQPVILLYHRIGRPELDPWGLSVSPENFVQQMAYLRQFRRPMALDGFVDGLCQRQLPANAVAVTFDDGYVDNLTVAKPILAAHLVPATLFLVTGAATTPTRFWWDEVARLILNSPGAIDETITIQGVAHRLRWDAEDRPAASSRRWRAWQPAVTPRQSVYVAIWRSLRDCDEEARLQAMTWLRSRFGTIDMTSDLAMTDIQVEELLGEAVFELGAHSLLHPVLTRIGPQDWRREIAGSRARCTRIAGRPVTGFAYPYGAFSAEVRADVVASGFTWACSATSSVTGRGGIDRFALPRLTVEDWGTSQFAEVLVKKGFPDRAGT